MVLVLQSGDHKNRHVSLDTVLEFESVILNCANRTVTSSGNQLRFRLINKLYHRATRLVRWFCRIIAFLPSAGDKKNIFAVSMGLDLQKILIPFTFSKNCYLYLFDAWPSAHQAILRIVSTFNLKKVYVSSSQAAERLNKCVPSQPFRWVPEGIDPREYRFCPVNKKNIDVLALGRRYDKYHNRIVDILEVNNKIYLYEKEKGAVVFPLRKDFIDGLAHSKISICVPSSITHPERAEGIETMTVRYLQSMASKCLVVGKAPAEMLTLFGYNPVVEIDETDPAGQIIDLCNRFAEFEAIIERNFEAVLRNHTWVCRWNLIREDIGGC